MSAKDNLGGQWVSREEHEENMNIVNGALQNHPKRVGIGLLSLGMQGMGRPTDRGAWAEMARLAQTDADAFHNDVKDLRRIGIAKRQQNNTNRNSRRNR